MHLNLAGGLLYRKACLGVDPAILLEAEAEYDRMVASEKTKVNDRQWDNKGQWGHKNWNNKNQWPQKDWGSKRAWLSNYDRDNHKRVRGSSCFAFLCSFTSMHEQARKD